MPGTIVFKIEKVMKILNVTPNTLATRTGVRKNSIYSIIRGEVIRLPLEHLIAILDCLNAISKERDLGERFTLDDVMEYIPEEKERVDF